MRVIFRLFLCIGLISITSISVNAQANTRAQAGEDTKPSATVRSSYAGAKATRLGDDDSYSPLLKAPVYEKNGPVVLLDMGHLNPGFSDGISKLLIADGYQVHVTHGRFTYEQLRPANVLVIMNPGVIVPRKMLADPQSAFTEEETSALHDWVAGGGSLLLAGHSSPQNIAVDALLRRFGVEFSHDLLFDRIIDPPPSSSFPIATPRTLSSENGLLASHKIITGRSSAESIKTIKLDSVTAITQAPENAVALLRCSNEARLMRHDPLQTKEITEGLPSLSSNPSGEIRTSIAPAPVIIAAPRVPVAIAFTLGKGRVVILGNGLSFSAMMSEMVFEGKPVQRKFGLMDADNQQFILNVMHWLSGALE